MLYPELAELDANGLVERLVAPCPVGDEYATAYYDDVAITLRARGQRGTDTLSEHLSTLDELRAASILVAFATPPLDESMIPGFVRILTTDGHACFSKSSMGSVISAIMKPMTE